MVLCRLKSALFKDLSRATGIVGWVVFSLTKFAHGPARPKIWVFTIHSICGGVGFLFLELGLHYQDKDFKGCRRGFFEFDFKGCWRGFLNFCLFLHTASSTIRIPRKKWSGCRRFYFPWGGPLSISPLGFEFENLEEDFWSSRMMCRGVAMRMCK